jgi:XTP/dITP diphosphohydrolase
MEILLASNNRDKADEFERIFWNHTILLPSSLGLDFEHDEKGTSFLENAYGKARACYDLAQMPVLADDSGLCVDALGGIPGINSARFGESEGKRLSASEKNILLLSKIERVTERAASFVCCLVLILSEYRFFIAQETCDGIITHEQKGTGGFGYDPLFFLEDKGMTIAELPDREKDEISHRGNASKRILSILDSL